MLTTTAPAGLPPADAPIDLVASVSPTTATISPAKLALWGPRWTPSSISASIRQYSLETGWVEGTVYQWSVTQTDHDDVVFHTALDVMAATLHRSKSILIHSEKMSDADSISIAAEIKHVEKTMKDLLEQFAKIRVLETDIMAWNVGVGMEQHYGLFRTFETVVREKLVGGGLEKAEEAFKVLDRMFTETIEIFKGPPGSVRPVVEAEKVQGMKMEVVGEENAE